MSKYKIDLNSDLGESFGNYSIGMDEEIIKVVSSANIACGWHAGDPLVLDKTIALAKQYGTGIGAHPGFPDLLGFGRREMDVTEKEAFTYTLYQIGAFYAFAKKHGVKIQHVKPHGAFYNMAAKKEHMAKGICEAIASLDENIIVMGISGGLLKDAAQKAGLRFVSEFFADRAYEDDGSLVNRRKEGAVLHDPDQVVKRVIKVAKTGTVTTITGKELQIDTQTICVHGDNREAIEFVKKIKDSLLSEEIDVVPVAEVIK